MQIPTLTVSLMFFWGLYFGRAAQFSDQGGSRERVESLRLEKRQPGAALVEELGECMAAYNSRRNTAGKRAAALADIRRMVMEDPLVRPTVVRMIQLDDDGVRVVLELLGDAKSQYSAIVRLGAVFEGREDVRAALLGVLRDKSVSEVNRRLVAQTMVATNDEGALRTLAEYVIEDEAHLDFLRFVRERHGRNYRTLIGLIKTMKPDAALAL